MLQAALRSNWLNKAVVPGKAILCLVVILWCWGAPVAYVDTADVQPLYRWMSAKQNRGSVACAPALLVSQVASAALVRLLVPDA